MTSRTSSRRVAGLAVLAMLASCIPPGHPAGRRPVSRAPAATRIPPSAAAVRSAPDNAARRQCLAQLSADGASFQVLPDRIYSGQCSALNAVQLTDIGLPVTNLGQMTCPLADAFTRWTRDAQGQAQGWLRSRIVRVESFGTYSCRPVNNVAGARLSEHGLSNAVDVSGFVLADGRHVTVLDGWSGGDTYVRDFLRAVHQRGCERFHVVLGPDANALHRNHFHFDMGPGRACE